MHECALAQTGGDGYYMDAHQILIFPFERRKTSISLGDLT
jgi:hypothetical protein